MASVTSWIAGSTNVNPDIGFARFNSGVTFNRATTTTNAELTIWLRMFFMPSTLALHKKEIEYDNLDGTKTKVGIRQWKQTADDPNEFLRFVGAVKALAEVFWDNADFCLIPPKDYKGLHWPPQKPTHQLNLNCRFQVVQAASEADAHTVIQCTRIDESSKNQFIRSWMSASARKGAFDSGDVPAAMLSKDPMAIGKVAYTKHRNTIPHEVGHAIGLPHIGVLTQHSACLAGAKANPTEGTNISMCYDGPKPEDSDNVMGTGWKVSLHNCLPWFWRGTAHCLGTDYRHWRVRIGKLPPRPL